MEYLRLLRLHGVGVDMIAIMPAFGGWGVFLDVKTRISRAPLFSASRRAADRFSMHEPGVAIADTKARIQTAESDYLVV
jgi:hypothetical protein